MKKNIICFLTKMLPDNVFVPLYFFYVRKEILHIKHPKTFSEKIQWIKLYGRLEKFSQYVDKLLVRDYVRRIIGDKYLVPLIGQWNTFEDIPFDKLPKKYALKATHGSGYNFICQDNSILEKNTLRRRVSAWLRENYYMLYREIQYKQLVPKIMCEEYLEDELGGLTDYKFFCFHGKAKIIQIDSDRFSEHKRDLRDIHWNLLPITLQYPNSKKHMEKPKKLQEMIGIAEKLSRDFLFVRVDLYAAKDNIYFGELTFTPGNGILKFTPSNADRQVGEFLDLTQIRNKKN